jgi:hypothetical protein
MIDVGSSVPLRGLFDFFGSLPSETSKVIVGFGSVGPLAIVGIIKIVGFDFVLAWPSMCTGSSSDLGKPSGLLCSITVGTTVM